MRGILEPTKRKRLTSSGDSVDYKKHFDEVDLQEKTRKYKYDYKNDEQVNNDEERKIKKLSHGIAHNFLIY